MSRVGTWLLALVRALRASRVPRALPAYAAVTDWQAHDSEISLGLRHVMPSIISWAGLSIGPMAHMLFNGLNGAAVDAVPASLRARYPALRCCFGLIAIVRLSRALTTAFGAADPARGLVLRRPRDDRMGIRATHPVSATTARESSLATSETSEPIGVTPALLSSRWFRGARIRPDHGASARRLCVGPCDRGWDPAAVESLRIRRVQSHGHAEGRAVPAASWTLFRDRSRTG